MLAPNLPILTSDREDQLEILGLKSDSRLPIGTHLRFRGMQREAEALGSAREPWAQLCLAVRGTSAQGPSVHRFLSR